MRTCSKVLREYQKKANVYKSEFTISGYHLYKMLFNLCPATKQGLRTIIVCLSVQTTDIYTKTAAAWGKQLTSLVGKSNICENI